MTIPIGTLTIGQSPRPDVVPALANMLGPRFRILEAGALDGLSGTEIAGIAPRDGELAHRTRMRDGSPTPLLSHARLVPYMQTQVDALVNQGVACVVVLCAADWSELNSKKLIVNAGPLSEGVITSLAARRKLGVIRPKETKLEDEQRYYGRFGIKVALASANPYLGDARLDAARLAAEQLREANVDLVWMACVGMDEPMRKTVSEIVQRPIVLAQSLLAHVTAEVLAAS